MEYIKPEGCNAAITSNWEHISGTYRLTARMVCGERNNIADGSFTRSFMDLDHGTKSDRVEKQVSADVTTTLGAMCLGCPYKNATS